ncbi:unnamed protein product [Rotaria sp. Silwood1]|nr:unnamed protein product [Rotaria sp. Silwood1]
MSSEELQQLENSIGKIISINSFFSTTMIEKQALQFVTVTCEPPNNRLEKVLFKITADPRVGSTKPFANIRNMSYFPNESEVLFMLGSIFQLNEVERNQGEDGKLAIIRMSLCGNTNDDFNKLYDYMKEQNGTEETNLLSLGHVLCSMGQFNLAEQYCHRFLKELSLVDSLRVDVYCELGIIAKSTEQYDKSLELYHKALECSMQSRPSDHVAIANIHNSIGEVHWAKDEQNQALESFKQAVAILEQAHHGMHHDMALFQDNIGRAYEYQKKYSEAVVYYARSLMIRQKCLPSDDPELAMSFTNVGSMRLCLNMPDLASAHLKRALEIRRKKLPPQHPDIAVSEKNLGDLYERQGKSELARKHFMQALEIQKNSLPYDHPDIAKTEKHLGDFYEHHGEYQLALESFEKALKIYEKTMKSNQLEHPIIEKIKQDIERVSKAV